jgi:hypothetical protein
MRLLEERSGIFLELMGVPEVKPWQPILCNAAGELTHLSSLEDARATGILCQIRTADTAAPVKPDRSAKQPVQPDCTHPSSYGDLCLTCGAPVSNSAKMENFSLMNKNIKVCSSKA